MVLCGQARTDDDKRRVKEYETYNHDDLLQILRYKFPIDYKDIAKHSVSDNYIAELLVKLENNVKLVQYYSSELGFTQMSPYKNFIIMSNLLSYRIHRCSE